MSLARTVGGMFAMGMLAICWLSSAKIVSGAQEPTGVDFYTQKVQPILSSTCYRCHGGTNHRGGLQIDSRASLLKGGRDGVVVVPGHADQSLLVKLIRHEGPANDPMPMPPKPHEKLSDADIATITKWINDGALMPDVPPAPK